MKIVIFLNSYTTYFSKLTTNYSIYNPKIVTGTQALRNLGCGFEVRDPGSESQIWDPEKRNPDPWVKKEHRITDPATRWLRGGTDQRHPMSRVPEPGSRSGSADRP